MSIRQIIGPMWNPLLEFGTTQGSTPAVLTEESSPAGFVLDVAKTGSGSSGVTIPRIEDGAHSDNWQIPSYVSMWARTPLLPADQHEFLCIWFGNDNLAIVVNSDGAIAMSTAFTLITPFSDPVLSTTEWRQVRVARTSDGYEVLVGDEVIHTGAQNQPWNTFWIGPVINFTSESINWQIHSLIERGDGHVPAGATVRLLVPNAVSSPAQYTPNGPDPDVVAESFVDDGTFIEGTTGLGSSVRHTYGLTQIDDVGDVLGVKGGKRVRADESGQDTMIALLHDGSELSQISTAGVIFQQRYVIADQQPGGGAWDAATLNAVELQTRIPASVFLTERVAAIRGCAAVMPPDFGDVVPVSAKNPIKKSISVANPARVAVSRQNTPAPRITLRGGHG